jgi:hypothetical protein
MLAGAQGEPRASASGSASATADQAEAAPCEAAAQRRSCVAAWVVSATSTPLLILSGYLGFYLGVVCTASTVPPAAFTSALVVAVLVGLALNLNALGDFRPPSLGAGASWAERLALFWRLRHWSILRLLLVPFCVSSYSAVAQAQPQGSFLLVFPTGSVELGVGIASMLAVPLLLLLLKLVALRQLKKRTGNAPGWCLRKERSASLCK